MKIKERHCNGCNLTKPIDKFGVDKHGPYGKTTRCKECRNKQCKIWADANQDKVKESNLKYKEFRKEYYGSPERKLKYRTRYIEKSFGISYTEYERMQREQNNVCAICHQPEVGGRHEYLCVDHDHTTGKIRQLLCNKCNRFLGWVNEDVKILNEMINYINKHNNESVSPN